MRSKNYLILLFASACIPAWAQDPLVTLPQNYQSIFENSAVQVIRAHYGLHEKIPVHDHPAVATVFVYLNNSGQVQINHADANGKVDPVVRPPTVKGAYRIAAALAERHSIENLSDTPSDFLRVELKQTNLQLPEPYRGKAPSNLAQSEDTTEFTNSAIQIERIVCSAPDSALCIVKPSGSPSLLIAFTPLHLTIVTSVLDERHTMDLAAGTVQWLSPGQLVTVAREPAAPAHILRILLPEPQK